jgi:hypothetical protein
MRDICPVEAGLMEKAGLVINNIKKRKEAIAFPPIYRYS